MQDAALNRVVGFVRPVDPRCVSRQEFFRMAHLVHATLATAQDCLFNEPPVLATLTTTAVREHDKQLEMGKAQMELAKAQLARNGATGSGGGSWKIDAGALGADGPAGLYAPSAGLGGHAASQPLANIGREVFGSRNGSLHSIASGQQQRAQRSLHSSLHGSSGRNTPDAAQSSVAHTGRNGVSQMAADAERLPPGLRQDSAGRVSSGQLQSRAGSHVAPPTPANSITSDIEELNLKMAVRPLRHLNIVQISTGALLAIRLQMWSRVWWPTWARS